MDRLGALDVVASVTELGAKSGVESWHGRGWSPESGGPLRGGASARFTPTHGTSPLAASRPALINRPPLMIS